MDEAKAKIVHPRTDRTWRNASYDLTSIPLEASRVFYRSRLRVIPKTENIDAITIVLGCLLDWIATKEGKRIRSGMEGLQEYLPAKDALMESAFVLGGYSHTCTASSLRTEAFFDEKEDGLPTFWAMEYIERDQRHGYRFWLTEVGVSLAGADMRECVVNARVRYCDDSTYIYATETPERNVPKFVRDIIHAPNSKACCGGVELNTYAIVLTQDNFDEFVEQLIDVERTVPLVVVSRRDGDGGKYDYPVNPLKLARLLAGVAVVYALDRSDEPLERSYRYVFGNPNKPAYKYRLEPGCLRIFWDGVDLDEPAEYDYAKHRFFTSEALEAFGTDTVFQNISAGMSRMFSLGRGEVLSIRSVKHQSSRARVDILERKRQQVLERLIEAEAKSHALEQEIEHSERTEKSLEAYREQIDVLNELLGHADEEIKELKQQHLRQDGGINSEEYELLFTECDRIQNEADAAREIASDLKRENGQLKYRVGMLEAEARELVSLAQRDRDMGELLVRIGRNCRSTQEAIDIARTVFCDRIVFLDDALNSAHEFTGQASEMFAALEAMHEKLWTLRFGPDGTVNVDAGEFKACTGFEVSFHESKHTNRDSRLVRMRQHNYCGKTYDFIAHVKGGDRKRGHLRIHFIFDQEQKLIVVGHCGNHLETYGTQRL